jgi:hypothetical protein
MRRLRDLMFVVEKFIVLVDFSLLTVEWTYAQLVLAQLIVCKYLRTGTTILMRQFVGMFLVGLQTDGVAAFSDTRLAFL